MFSLQMQRKLNILTNTHWMAYLNVLLSNGLKMFKTVCSLNKIGQQGFYQRQGVQRQRLPVSQVIQVFSNRSVPGSNIVLRVPAHSREMYNRQNGPRNLYIDYYYYYLFIYYYYKRAWNHIIFTIIECNLKSPLLLWLDKYVMIILAFATMRRTVLLCDIAIIRIYKQWSFLKSVMIVSRDLRSSSKDVFTKTLFALVLSFYLCFTSNER